MEKLRNISQKKIGNTNLRYKRYLYTRIDWTNRLIAIRGARGVGKTTMILQYIKEHFPNDHSVLYASLDDIYFSANTLVDLAETFSLQGGKGLFLDEVHKYPAWSRELKNIYDNHPELQVVFTSSSILQIYKGFADLSRRLVTYDLHGLSFREFLSMTGKFETAPVSLTDILGSHLALSQEIIHQIRPLEHFRNYLQYGYYPFFMENIPGYAQKLVNCINLTLECDLPSAQNIEYASIHKLKKLLYLISTSVPFKPNISNLSEQVHATRATVIQYLDHLKNAQIINLLNTDSLGTGYLSKPERIYLQNSNIMYALAPEMVNQGNLRETFFLNQTGNMHEMTMPERGDFVVDKKYTFEVGGKNKTFHQIANIANSYIAADEIEIGYQNKVPLWLFGFLY